MQLHNSAFMRQILIEVEKAGLKGYLEVDMGSWNMEDIAEFFYNGYVRDNSIHSKVRGTEVVITD